MVHLLGYTEEEFYAMTFPEITHKDDLEDDMIQVEHLLQQNIESYQIEKRYFHKKGQVVWVLLSVSLEFNEDGKPLYFISQVVDITKSKEMLWQMNAISNIAKNQNERLKDFAHIATHDIRTHLGNLFTITGFLEEELEGIAQDGNFKMLKHALSQLDSTITHLNEVRRDDFSAKDSLKPLSLNSFVENAIYNISTLARHGKCEIINEVDPDIKVMAVPVYLDSVILNLLSNAVKYRSRSRRAYVQLRTIIHKEFVILEVNDNGLGIDMAKNGSTIFQFEKTFHDQEDARGIGMFITKNHVENMGGKIEVESLVDVGSTFKVYLKRG